MGVDVERKIYDLIEKAEKAVYQVYGVEPQLYYDTFLDTAEIYGLSLKEILITKIKKSIDFPIEPEVFITPKGFSSWFFISIAFVLRFGDAKLFLGKNKNIRVMGKDKFLIEIAKRSKMLREKMIEIHKLVQDISNTTYKHIDALLDLVKKYAQEMKNDSAQKVLEKFEAELTKWSKGG